MLLLVTSMSYANFTPKKHAEISMVTALATSVDQCPQRESNYLEYHRVIRFETGISVNQLNDWLDYGDHELYMTYRKKISETLTCSERVSWLIQTLSLATKAGY